jgi:hypothetical protein
MARSFDGVNDWIGNNAQPLVSHGTNAFTVAFWLRSLDNARTNDYICSGLGGENAGALIYEYVDNQIEFDGNPGGGTDPRTSSGITIADTNWHHVAYRKQSGTAEWAKYLDGSKTVINASISFNLSGAAQNHFKLGASTSTGTAGDFANIELARFGVWNSAVADAHIEAMAKGMNPLKFRPTHYWELLGNDSPERATFGGLSLTVTGATKADHPRGVVTL